MCVRSLFTGIMFKVTVLSNLSALCGGAYGIFLGDQRHQLSTSVIYKAVLRLVTSSSLTC